MGHSNLCCFDSILFFTSTQSLLEMQTRDGLKTSRYFWIHVSSLPWLLVNGDQLLAVQWHQQPEIAKFFGQILSLSEGPSYRKWLDHSFLPVICSHFSSGSAGKQASILQHAVDPFFNDTDSLSDGNMTSCNSADWISSWQFAQWAWSLPLSLGNDSDCNLLFGSMNNRATWSYFYRVQVLVCLRRASIERGDTKTPHCTSQTAFTSIKCEKVKE